MMIDWLTIVILGLVEGITEFIPVSSTGHLIVVGHLLGYEGEHAATFEIFIQLGAILSVVFLYKDTFLQLFTRQRGRGLAGPHGLLLLSLTTLPILVVGFLLHGIIKTDRLIVFGGGYPITTDAGIIGGIGVSGGHYTHDMEVAQAGLAAL